MDEPRFNRNSKLTKNLLGTLAPSSRPSWPRLFEAEQQTNTHQL
jgi:hypothetical protein